MTLNDAPVQVNTDLLGQRVLLLSPTLKRWSGMLQLPAKTEVHMDHRVLDATTVTTPRVKLMTKTYPMDSDGKPWRSRFDSTNTRLTALKNLFSVNFPIHGVRIIPKTVANDFMHQLFGPTIGYLNRQLTEARDRGDTREAESIMDQLYDSRDSWGSLPTSNSTPVRDVTSGAQSIAFDFWENVKEFVNDYDNVMSQIAAHHECWDVVKDKVPKNKLAMFKKFDLGVFPVELSGTNPNEVSMQDLENHADIVRDTCQRQVEMAIENMIREPRAELAGAIENIENLIRDNGKITVRTFDRVTRAIEKLNNFSFVTNGELMDRLQRLNTMLDTTIPARLRADQPEHAVNTAAFSRALSDIRQDVLDKGIMESDLSALGCHSRAIFLDDHDDE